MTSTTDRLEALFASRVRDVVPPLFGAAGEPVRPLISLSYGLADPILFPRAELNPDRRCLSPRFELRRKP
jgi:hypothetical protein